MRRQAVQIQLGVAVAVADSAADTAAVGERLLLAAVMTTRMPQFIKKRQKRSQMLQLLAVATWQRTSRSSGIISRRHSREREGEGKRVREREREGVGEWKRAGEGGSQRVGRRSETSKSLANVLLA